MGAKRGAHQRGSRPGRPGRHGQPHSLGWGSKCDIWRVKVKQTLGGRASMAGVSRGERQRMDT